MENSKTIVITTLSNKEGKFCVAGLDLESYKWCRIISDDVNSHGAIDWNKDLIDVYNRIPQVGDCIKFWFDPNNKKNNVQSENYLLDRSKSIEITDELGLNYILNHCPVISENESIYVDSLPYITEAHINEVNCSLLAAKVTSFVLYMNAYNKLKCSFIHNNHHYKEMSFTMSQSQNPDTGNAYLEVNKKYDNALVIVSIGEPILYQGRENRYYKFVSTVIPFVENAD